MGYLFGGDDPAQPLQDGEEVPATVVAGERMDLVDDHGADAGEEAAMVGADADEHRFQ